MEEKDILKASEPVAALLSEEVRRSSLLSERFKSDELGRILLTKEMREAVTKAERDYEDGKCFSEADFKERFAKWL